MENIHFYKTAAGAYVLTEVTGKKAYVGKDVFTSAAVTDTELFYPRVAHAHKDRFGYLEEQRGIPVANMLNETDEVYEVAQVHVLVEDFFVKAPAGGGGGTWGSITGDIAAQTDLKGLLDEKYSRLIGGSGYVSNPQTVETLNGMGFSLAGATLSGANLSDTTLSGANLSGANLSGATLSGAYLDYATLSGANLSDANLSGANLSGADLNGANLSGANLSNATLDGANFANADVSNAFFLGADLSGACFDGTIVSNANFKSATVTNTDINVTLANVNKDANPDMSPLTVKWVDETLYEWDGTEFAAL